MSTDLLGNYSLESLTRKRIHKDVRGHELGLRTANFSLRDRLFGKIDPSDVTKRGEFLRKPSHAATEIQDLRPLQLERTKYRADHVSASACQIIKNFPLLPMLPVRVPEAPLLFQSWALSI